MSETSEKKTLRQWLVLPLALPIWFLGFLTVCLIHVVAWWSHSVCPWISNGLGNHFYWPFVQIRRAIEGTPRWVPVDLRIHKQPRTDAERAAAELHPNVYKAVCLCPEPDCKNKTTPMYVWSDLPYADTEPNLLLMEAQRSIIDNARKAVEYDQIVARSEELKARKDQPSLLEKGNDWDFLRAMYEGQTENAAQRLVELETVKAELAEKTRTIEELRATYRAAS